MTGSPLQANAIEADDRWGQRPVLPRPSSIASEVTIRDHYRLTRRDYAPLEDNQ
jgi:hypothetical protein